MHIQKILIRIFIVLFFSYACIWQPTIIVYPIVTAVGLIQYPFFYIYSLAIQPLVDGVHSCKTHKEYHRILQANYDERSRLLKELIDARGKLAYYQDLQNAGITYTTNTVCIAQIVYKQLRQDNSFFIIDKGSADGVTPDMVAVLNNLLLGRVTQVYRSYAQVMPLHNPQCHVPIVCAESHARGVFRGCQADDSIGQLDFISHLEQLIKDELVITSGDGLMFPQGLAVGRIKKFTLNELGFLYDVDIEPLFDIEKISYCSVISKNTQQALHKKVSS
ncbi:MAG: rod shape-determining protein MreC [Candidatus Babeliaceae bacterium]|nr:rod shape-determining protein MreC [Candidatus Babeliaceae bacterium]